MAATIHDLPDVILANILSLVSDVRSRNSASLVSRKWLAIERLTRTHLTLRGNVRELLFHLPTCFRSVTHLDLSLLSPWGLSLIPLSLSSSDDDTSFLLSHRLRLAFPSATSLTFYSRSPLTLSLLAPFFPALVEVKLVRWHQRPQIPVGSDFFPLFEKCPRLRSLDLSCFYFWTEDLPPALDAYPEIGRNLVSLNLLDSSLAEGFKSHEVISITSACPNLRELRIGCMFDPRYIGFVGDDALLAIPANCKDLRVLHMADICSSQLADFDEEGFGTEDAGFSTQALVGFFSGLGLIEELVLDVCKNVRESWVALEALSSKCPNLRTLKLGHFHGVCKAIESQLDGIALCQGLESLSIRNCADLTDFGLIAVGRGCSRLAKFEAQGCRRITMRGLRTMVCLLKQTLVDVSISGCKYLDASASIQAVEPIRDQIRRLHIDCVWVGEKPDNEEELVVQGFDLNEMEDEDEDDMGMSSHCDIEETRMKKRCKFSSDALSWYPTNGRMNMNGFLAQRWDRLEFLSLWIGVGELLTPLTNAGLEDCPNLSEIHIKVEGDCREKPKPSQSTFGISSLCRYPKLSKMKLDFGDTIGYALTAPSGHMDLSLWERFFLNGIKNLSLNELDYWPPQDREVNQRSLSLPAAGLLAQCDTLRKLFIHGTAHEHFMMFLIRIPNLRDVQLRGDYYPAPENDMSTEMRVDSCCRFEYKLNARQIPD